MNVIYMIVVYLVWFLAAYFTIFFLLLVFSNRKELFEEHPFPWKRPPLVSIIVPAYNEEGKVTATVKSLKRLAYDPFEVILVNDGSADGTAREIRAAINGDARFRFLDRKENKGKSAALNEGIRVAQGRFVACMDADSVVEPDIFMKALPYFTEKRVGAVTVTVDVLEPKGLLQKLIDIEFTIGLSLFLKVFSSFECIFVTPGPFSLYRRSVLLKIGGFDEGNITEDLEIAYRLHKAGYRIRNAMEARVYTAIPPTFKGVYRQRRRWYAGALETLFQHRDVLFKRRYGLFGFFLPFNYTLIALGLGVFLYTTYLGLSHLFTNLWNFHYTNFNFVESLKYWRFDILTFGRVSLLGLVAFLFTIVLLFVGLYYTRKDLKGRKLGVVCYPLLFFLYQIFWISAFNAVFRRKKVSWR